MGTEHKRPRSFIGWVRCCCCCCCCDDDDDGDGNGDDDDEFIHLT